MSDDIRRDPPIYAPTALAKIRAKKAELNAAVERGEMTVEDAREALRTFQSLSIAHVREHGSEDR